MRDRAPRVLIAGGGVAALEALLTLHERLAGAVELTLLAPEPDFVYRPLTVLEPFTGEAAPALPLAEIAAEHGATLVRDALAAVDAPADAVARPDGVGGAVSTRDGRELPFDELIVAVGAVPRPTPPGTLRFGDPAEAGAVARVVEAARAGEVERISLSVPPGVAWTLPLYELALAFAALRGPAGHRPGVLVTTAEAAPLQAFGSDASAVASAELSAAGVQLETASVVERFEDGLLWIEFEGATEADAAIALPSLHGPAIPGLAADPHGFLPTDRSCRVEGQQHVYAAGDAAAHPIKQGGLAAQQADVAAEQIAWRLRGEGPEPPPYEPVLRGLLLHGAARRYLRAELTPDEGTPATAVVSDDPEWWPPAKLFALRLGPYLASHARR